MAGGKGVCEAIIVLASAGGIIFVTDLVLKKAANMLIKQHNKRLCINIIPQLVIFAIAVLAKGYNIHKFCRNEQYRKIKLVKTTKEKEDPSLRRGSSFFRGQEQKGRKMGKDK